MIYLIAHLIFAVFGIATLAKGKVSLSKQAEISGPRARLIGILALLTYPIAWVFGFGFAIYWGTSHPGEDFPIEAALFVNFGAIVLVGIGIFLVARRAAKDSPADAE